MVKKIKIKINGKEIECDTEKTIGRVAHENNISIPGLCFHPDFKTKGNCRLCVVEIKNKKDLVTACSTLVEDGMEIITENPRIKKTRTTNLELIFAEHIERCNSCVQEYNCALLKIAKKYNINSTSLIERKKNRKKYNFANAVELDQTQCIDCRNCIDACSLMQKINYLELRGKGHNQEIIPTENRKINCILCGQCALHCPVSACQEQTDFETVEKLLKDSNKTIVVQFAPSVRVSIGEEFNLPYGEIVSEQLVTALKKIGFKFVFDVNFGADVTTMVEAEELLERIKENKKLPMITSCCPAWVNYVEFYHPELLENITTARSPHIHGGGIIKTYWAEKMNIKPKKIIVVSIMPCTAKKYEATRRELKINGSHPVDYVLTTRELAFLLKKNNIDLSKLKKSKVDSLIGEYSGAAAIYGGSGGVMESALRTAQYLACPEKCDIKIDFKEVRGLDGIKEATVSIAGKELKIVVVNGIGNIEPIIKNLKNYDYIEVMACPGGCIGGGGQPIPTTNEIRKKRIEALYQIDKDSKIRKAHENKEVSNALDWLKTKGDLNHEVLHTSYKKRTGY
jgi:NADP-reducing hydrogenase subunit HndD